MVSSWKWISDTMENLPPLNQPTKLIRPPTVKRERSGDSHGGKVRINFSKYRYLNKELTS